MPENTQLEKQREDLFDSERLTVIKDVHLLDLPHDNRGELIRITSKQGNSVTILHVRSEDSFIIVTHAGEMKVHAHGGTPAILVTKKVKKEE